jgi:hypothetical protein
MAFVHMKDSGCHVVAGKFTGGTSPAVSVGKGFSVAYTATGLYTVTIKAPKPKATSILYAHAQVVESGSIAVTEPDLLQWRTQDNDDGTVTFLATRGVVALTALTLTEGTPNTLSASTLTNTRTAAALPSDAFVSFFIVYSQSTLVA